MVKMPKIPKTPEVRGNVLELFVLMGCMMAPIFILANEVDGDEFLKATSGIVLAALWGGILTAYKLWKSG